MKNLTLEHIAQACKGIYKGSEADKTREVTEKSRKEVFSCLLKERGRTVMIL